MTEEKALTPEQIGEQLQISADVIRRLLRSKQLKGFKMGKEWRVYPSEVEAYIKRQTNVQ